MLNDRRKYLLAVPLLMLSAFCLYFNFAFSRMSQALLEQQMLDREAAVDVICDVVDRLVEEDQDWGKTDRYKRFLSYSFTRLDKLQKSYAELFDHQMNSLSARTPMFDGGVFDPNKYPDFTRAVAEMERGKLVIPYSVPGVPEHDLYLYFRWVPTDKTLKNRLLVVIGESQHSVDAQIDPLVEIGAFVLIFVSAAFITGAVILLCRLGRVYSLRGDNKWVSKTSS